MVKYIEERNVDVNKSKELVNKSPTFPLRGILEAVKYLIKSGVAINKK